MVTIVSKAAPPAFAPEEAPGRPGRGGVGEFPCTLRLETAAARTASVAAKVAGLAHEIRSLLTVCSSAAQFILEDGQDPEFRRLCLEKMLTSIARTSVSLETLLRLLQAPESIEIVDLKPGALGGEAAPGGPGAEIVKENGKGADG